MLSEQITSWLSNSDNYSAGLDLLTQTGFSGFTLSILAKGDDTYNRTRLEAELRKWLDKPENVLRSGQSTATGSKQNSEIIQQGVDYGGGVNKAVMVAHSAIATEPVALIDIRHQVYQLIDERSEAKALLRAKEDLGNSDEAIQIRAPYALRIKAITRQIDELMSRIDFFEQNGYLPSSEPDIVVDDTVALMNARSYVSRYKAKLKKKNLTHEQRESAEKLLKQYSDTKDRLERKLGKTDEK